jgi:formylglycine-generating enzyme required for sulfatase activity
MLAAGLGAGGPGLAGPGSQLRPEAPVQMVNSLGMTLIRVEPGTFWRGSPPEETGHRPNETRHQVTLTCGYWLGATEVTQAQYEAVMDQNPSAFADPDRPVENVPWFDWVRFCNRLSEREGLDPVYTIDQVQVSWDRSANGYRLPTEAEWEHACRAGTGTRFHVGDRTSELVEVAWFRVNSDWQTQPVAAKPANPWGFHDMHGNVFEWCWDLYEAYSEAAMVDPVGAELGARRVLRGGGWGSYSRGCRSAYRQASEPSARRAWYGARIARNLDPSAP